MFSFTWVFGMILISLALSDGVYRTLVVKRSAVLEHFE